MPPLNLPNFEPTIWEQKLRAYRLKNETSEVRTWREEAEDPNTTGERLTQIFRAVRDRNRQIKKYDEGHSVEEAIARHPNTPPTTLVFLTSGHAKAFCQNPLAPFLLLEAPDFIARFGQNGYALLRQENAPAALIKVLAAAESPSNFFRQGLQDEAEMHILLSGEVQTDAEGEYQITVFWQKYLTRHIAYINDSERRFTPPTLPPDKMREERIRQEHLNELLQPNSELVELAFAPSWLNAPPFFVEPRWPELSQAAKEWLTLACDAPFSRESFALWTQVAPGLAARPELAYHVGPNADEEDLVTFVALEESRTGCLQEIIAAHPNTTPMVLERLFAVQSAREEDGVFFPNLVLRLIATHPNAHMELLTKLLHFYDAEVRRIVCRHPNAPKNAQKIARQSIMGFWKEDRSRMGMLGNFIGGTHGALSPRFLLMCGGSSWASGRLTAAINLPVESIPFPEKSNREAAKAGCTTRDLLEHLARDGNRLVRWAAQTRLQNPDYVFRWAEQ